jgi:L-aspartate oxidase
VNERGEAFMTRYHRDGDLAPRDVVARGIAREAEATGGRVFLTLAHLDPDYVRRRFPTIAAMCAQLGLDVATDRIPVGPAAHYIMGGVDTDEWARTSLPGLYAAGEVACTGVHGANRLASNSLLEGLVFGARAALAMQEWARGAALKPDRTMADGSWLMAHGTHGGGHHPYAMSHQPSAMDIEAVRDLMWRSVGLFRDRQSLARAVAALEQVETSAPPGTPEAWRHHNLLTVARLIARAALRREESRGGHFRADFPQRDDLHWKLHLVDQYHG